VKSFLLDKHYLQSFVSTISSLLYYPLFRITVFLSFFLFLYRAPLIITISFLRVSFAMQFFLSYELLSVTADLLRANGDSDSIGVCSIDQPRYPGFLPVAKTGSLLSRLCPV